MSILKKQFYGTHSATRMPAALLLIAMGLPVCGVAQTNIAQINWAQINLAQTNIARAYAAQADRPQTPPGTATSPPQTPPVSNSAANPGVPGTPASSASTPTGTTREVSWKKLFPNLLSDQKQIWLFPRKLKKKKVLIPTLAVLGVTAALIASDPTTGSYFRGSNSYSGFNSAFAGNNTSLGMLITPLAMYGAGLLKRNSKLQQTALLAGEAVAGSEILTTVFKDVDRRLRPRAIPIGGNFSDTWFEDNTNNFHSNGSFPSGHAIAAFSIATIVARQYGKEHKWVPWVAYGLAAAIGFSRLTLSAHFASDVFMGAAMGYSISRFVVLRQ